MCGRYQIVPDEDITTAEIIRVLQRRALSEPLKTSGDVLPGDTVPLLSLSRAGNLRPFAMTWGYTMPDGKRLINIRSETAAEKPMFRESAQLRRCLLPLQAYYEWRETEAAEPESLLSLMDDAPALYAAPRMEKRRYRIAPAEKGTHYLAGLYRYEHDRPVCAVLTRTAAENIAFIHPRMPVILPQAEAEAWLRAPEFAIPEAPAMAAAEG